MSILKRKRNININNSVAFSPASIVKESPETLKKWDQFFKLDGKASGLIVPVDYDVVKKMKTEERMYYCLMNGIYGIITEEILDFFDTKINNRSCIEIGAGHGTLGRELGLKITDSYLQRDNKEVVDFYKEANQPTINYPSDVEKINGNAAVKKYKPSVVIGSWITSKYNPNKPEIGGNIYGIDEIEMFRQNEELRQFIMIGNLKTHSNKPILSWKGVKAKEYKLPYLISRSRYTKHDRVFIFTRK